MNQNFFKYSNFLLYSSGLIANKNFIKFNLNVIQDLSEFDLDQFPTFKNYFIKTYNYELDKLGILQNLKKTAEETGNNFNIHPFSFIHDKEYILSKQFEIIKHCEVLTSDYNYSRLFYFEFSVGLNLDDYLEKVLKSKSHFLIKYDLFSNQEIEIKLSVIQRLVISFLSEGYSMKEIFAGIRFQKILPPIKSSKLYYSIMMNEIVPLIYWGFIIPKS